MIGERVTASLSDEKSKYEGTTPWTEFDQGDEVFAITQVIMGQLRSSSIVNDIMAYPFISGGVHNEVEELYDSIELLHTFLDDSEDEDVLSVEISNLPFIRAWLTGISFMIGSAINLPPLMEAPIRAKLFFASQVQVFQAFWQTIGGNEEMFPNEFLVDQLSSSEQLHSVHGGRLVTEATDLITRIESEPHEERVREVYSLLTTARSRYGTNEVKAACNSIAPEISMLGSYVEELNIASGDLEEMARLVPIEMLKLCFDSMSIHEKIELLPRSLFSVYPKKVSCLFSSPKLEVDQEATPQEQLESVLEQVGRLSRTSLSKQNIPVAFTGSPAMGPGTRSSLLSSISPLIFVEGDLFEFSDERQVFLKPRRGGPAAKFQMRAIGRLIGLGLKYRVPRIGARFTVGILRYLHNPLEEDSLDDSLTLLQKENPDLASSLANLRKNPDAVVGMNYLGCEDHRVVETSEETEAFIRETATYYVRNSIRDELQAIVQGIYDVVPFGYLSWFTLEELGVLLEGPSGPIDRAQLIHSIALSQENEDVGEESLTWVNRMIMQMDEGDLAEFLLFISGSATPPLTGFTSRNPSRAAWLEIEVDSSKPSSSKLPRASLCFLKLTIPKYDSFETFFSRMIFAIKNCKSMDLQ